MKASWLNRIIHVLLVLLPAVSAAQGLEHGSHPMLGTPSLLPSIASSSDSIMVFHVGFTDTQLIAPVPVDTGMLSAATKPSIPEDLLRSYLDTAAPVNTAPNSGFIKFDYANLSYPVNSYPLSAVVELYGMSSGERLHWCSGILVAPNIVLTAAHCVSSVPTAPGNLMWYDSLYAAPAYDNAAIPSEFRESLAKKYYIFKDWYNDLGWRDIALIELEEPIGLKTGWVGLGFNEDTQFLSTNNLHCFSYPGIQLPFDSTHDYNGDTMYYHYGRIDCMSNNAIGSRVQCIPGQSGSSILYTDNDSVYTSFGVMNYSACQGNFYRTKRSDFYQLRNIIDNHADSIFDPVIYSDALSIFPNPSSGQISFIITAETDQQVRMELLDICGRQVWKGSDYLREGENTLNISLPSLAPGAYFLKARAGIKTLGGRIIKIDQ